MSNQQDYERAAERVMSLRGFYANLISYFVVNLVLVIVNLAGTPDFLWFYWVTIFWGLGLIFHAADVFALRGRLLGAEWERHKIHELMDQEQEKKRKAG